MSNSKYNIERQFIEGYNIVDPVDQATFQSQIEVEFTGVTAIIDLSKSNFFVLDLEKCPGPEVYITLTNYSNTTRFELLLREPTEAKTIRWDMVTPRVIFPHPLYDEGIDEPLYAPEPMGSYKMRQQLITFRTTSDYSNSYHFVGVATRWFESRATHLFLQILLKESRNVVTKSIPVRQFPLSSNIVVTEEMEFPRGSSSCRVRLYVEETGELLDSNMSSQGIGGIAVPRVHALQDYSYRLEILDSNLTVVYNEIITASETRDNYELPYIDIELEDIQLWESPEVTSLGYMNGFVVKHNNYYYSSSAPPNTPTPLEPDLWDPEQEIYDRLIWSKWLELHIDGAYNGPGWYAWTDIESPEYPEGYYWEWVDVQPPNPFE